MSRAAVDAEGLRRFRPYPEYKRSDVQWLDPIPVEWSFVPLKSVLARNDSGVWGDDVASGGTVVLRSTDVTVSGEWRVESPATRSLSAKERAAAVLEVGDLLVTKSSGSALHLGKTALVTEEVASLRCCFSNFMQRLRFTDAADARFVAYLLNSPVGREQMNYFGSTTTGLANLNGQILGSISAPIPSGREQRAIAEFLDRETGKIDALVAKKERLIELLQEKRTALITHAVTKGLDPTTPTKPSGIDWLGDIPVHWEVKKLRHVLSGSPRNGVSPPIGPNGSVPTFSISAVRLGRVNIGEHLKYTDIAPAVAASFLVQKGDILLLRGNGNRSLVGRAGIVVEEPPAGCIYPDILIRVRPGPLIRARYLVECLNSQAIRLQIELAARTAAGIWKINGTSVGELKLPIPPLGEQDEIGCVLDETTDRIDTLVQVVNNGVDHLKELRIALISAAVTGKIDVRDEVA